MDRYYRVYIDFLKSENIPLEVRSQVSGQMDGIINRLEEFVKLARNSSTVLKTPVYPKSSENFVDNGKGIVDKWWIYAMDHPIDDPLEFKE